MFVILKNAFVLLCCDYRSWSEKKNKYSHSYSYSYSEEKNKEKRIVREE
jgi:hypothetical protein